jgi:hypothetical protein
MYLSTCETDLDLRENLVTQDQNNG